MSGRCFVFCSIALCIVLCSLHFAEAGTVAGRGIGKQHHISDRIGDESMQTARQNNVRDEQDSSEDSDEDDDDDDADRVQIANFQQQIAQEGSQEDSDEEGDDDDEEDRRRRRRREVTADHSGGHISEMSVDVAFVPPRTDAVEPADYAIPSDDPEPEQTVEIIEGSVATVASPLTNTTSVLILIRDALKKVTANLPAPTAQVANNALLYFQLFEHFLQQTIQQVIGDDDEEEDESSTIKSETEDSTSEDSTNAPETMHETVVPPANIEALTTMESKPRKPLAESMNSMNEPNGDAILQQKSPENIVPVQEKPAVLTHAEVSSNTI